MECIQCMDMRDIFIKTAVKIGIQITWNITNTKANKNKQKWHVHTFLHLHTSIWMKCSQVNLSNHYLQCHERRFLHCLERMTVHALVYQTLTMYNLYQNELHNHNKSTELWPRSCYETKVIFVMLLYTIILSSILSVMVYLN